jgi:hypothetical protein
MEDSKDDFGFRISDCEIEDGSGDWAAGDIEMEPWWAQLSISITVTKSSTAEDDRQDIAAP